MSRFFGKPTKFIRHVTDETVTLGPQRAQIIPFWYYNDSATARVDGADLTEKTMPLGSLISKHRIEMLVTPYTVEPQKLYYGMVKLSFHDVFAPSVCGSRFSLDAFQGTPTDTNATTFLKLWPADTDVTEVQNGLSADFDTGGIDAVKLDDYFKHWVRLNKAVVFDQRPLMTDKFMRVPAKVKRINDGTFYGMWIFNDAVRGGTPADTQVDINLKQYIEEWAI
jgi:hypothetical protein